LRDKRTLDGEVDSFVGVERRHRVDLKQMRPEVAVEQVSNP
jgi:hypothetical protein